jgi:hypothetical protein
MPEASIPIAASTDDIETSRFNQAGYCGTRTPLLNLQRYGSELR